MSSPGSSTSETESQSRTPLYIAGAVILAAALLGAALVASRKPCPCAEHQPEAEAERIAQASAEVRLRKAVEETPREPTNGKVDFPAFDQPEEV